MSKETGGLAFPTDYYYDGVRSDQIPGMTLRDYFAAKAMQGFIANPPYESWRDPDLYHIPAHAAYAMADAMLKERDK